MTSPGNQHCASCIGTLISFTITTCTQAILFTVGGGFPSTDARSLKPTPSWMNRSRSGKTKCGALSGGAWKPSKSGSTRFLHTAKLT